MRRFLIAIATASLFAVLVAPHALASPNVIESDPPDGATEHQAPDSVSITFDMPLDPESSLIKVVDECGRQIDAKNTTVQLNEMSVDIAQKPAGLYKAFYYADPPAGATGSSSGSISFTVHAGPACGPEAKGHEHGGGNENEGGHEGHEGGGEHEGHERPGSHDGHDDSTDHGTHSASSTGHSDHMSSMDHPAGGSGGDHSGHSSSGNGHANHGKKNGGGDTNVATGNAPGPRAAGGGDLALSDGQAILVSLGACLLLGLAGGWMVRTTQAPRKTA